VLHVICVPIKPLVGDNTGGEVLAGALTVATVMLLLLACAVLVTALVAVTTQSSVAPLSSGYTIKYVLLVAPAIFEPLRRHCRVNVGAGLPVHVPLLTLSVLPMVFVPLINGATVLAGAV
jgi:hypothetical protein